MWEKILRRLRGTGDGAGKRPLKETMLIIFLCGILLFVILLPTDKNSSNFLYKKTVEENTSLDNNLGIVGKNTTENTTDTYKNTLEQELEDFLSSVSGVGKVKVLIYMKESQKYIVEKDMPTTSSRDGEGSQESRDESTVYTRNDNGYEVPFVSQTRSPAIDGVVVAAEGAESEEIRLQIVRLVMALYSVEANKVDVSVLATEQE